MNNIVSYILGLLSGILICVTIYYIDTKKLKQKVRLTEKEETGIRIEKDTVYVEALPAKKNQPASSFSDKTKAENTSELLASEDDSSVYETEFSFDGNESDEVFADLLLNTRTVRTKLYHQEKQEGKLPENFFQFFEIQQWSTLIKNKITCYRNQNMVKIKGMDVTKAEVVFWNDAYYLELENLYYALPETENFEKLNIVNLPK
jgi:hypothetical protein